MLRRVLLGDWRPVPAVRGQVHRHQPGHSALEHEPALGPGLGRSGVRRAGRSERHRADAGDCGLGRHDRRRRGRRLRRGARFRARFLAAGHGSRVPTVLARSRPRRPSARRKRPAGPRGESAPLVGAVGGRLRRRHLPVAGVPAPARQPIAVHTGWMGALSAASLVCLAGVRLAALEADPVLVTDRGRGTRRRTRGTPVSSGYRGQQKAFEISSDVRRSATFCKA